MKVSYFEFSKPFDCVSHAHLLHKKRISDIRPSIVSWIGSFSTDSTFTVRLNTSSRRNGTCGGPKSEAALLLCSTHAFLNLVEGSEAKFCAVSGDIKIYHFLVKLDTFQT